MLNNFYLPPVFTNNTNLFLDEIMIGLETDDNNAEIRYTTDGSEPGVESLKYSEPFNISSSCTIKAKAFWKDGKESTVSSHDYTNASGTTIKSVNPEIKSEGLRYELYKGDWKKLPDFSQLNFEKSGITKAIDLSCTIMENEFGLRFSGYINISQTGIYSFYIDSDDGSKLSIAGKEILVNDGIHGMREVKADLALEVGWHEIELIYFQGRGGLGLKTYFQGPGIPKQIISGDLLGF
ncbi:FN3 associated domain-containing protein [Bacteroidota bacterium]